MLNDDVLLCYGDCKCVGVCMYVCVQALLVHKTSQEQLETRKQNFLEEKKKLEMQTNSLRTDFDLERKRRLELTAKAAELESKWKQSWAGRNASCRLGQVKE